MIKEDSFKDVINGEEIGLYRLKNKNGLEAVFTNYGQRLVALYVPDKDGNFLDVVLGFSSLHEYTEPKGGYFGAVIGRYGNRIANGKFSLNGNEYTLVKNNGENHLHGGVTGFNDVIWKTNSIGSNAVEFSRTSPDMEEGYPGNLDVTVTYKLTDANELKIEYKATTDKATPINLTNHSFFNLKGEGVGDVLDHVLTLNSNTFTALNENQVPTGELVNVKGTPFDFTTPKEIGKEINNSHEQLTLGNGYDHNFIVDSSKKNTEGISFAARVVEPVSGRVMEVYTNEPGMQLYTSNFLDGSVVGKCGKPYLKRGAVCLETQHYPDSPNQPKFPSTILNPNDTYSSVCIYKFLVE
ncbi:aldose 1-epimerase [Maribacter vaceletii]|uniref:Aldose 1-epimerase n=1 Tax=Maribacter vaceletii TaxID=1206816 RepID=A0A495E685_9FLAO|nr:aldose epimerase family protein [Maribacter vaceletii]RKR12211.1 aldose 1-epimerase [Maribacter vaceletii]